MTREEKKARAQEASKTIFEKETQEEWNAVILKEIGYTHLTRKVMEAYIKKWKPDKMPDYVKEATHYYSVQPITMNIKKVNGEEVEGKKTYTKDKWVKIEWTDKDTVKKAMEEVKADKEAKRKGDNPQSRYVFKFSPLEAKAYFAKTFIPELRSKHKEKKNDTQTGEDLFLSLFNENGDPKKTK